MESAKNMRRKREREIKFKRLLVELTVGFLKTKNHSQCERIVRFPFYSGRLCVARGVVVFRIGRKGQ